VFDPEKFVKEQIEHIQRTVKGKAIIACSGGVDSTVAAAIAGRALGNDLVTVFVDTGIMREDEATEVRETLRKLQLNFRVIDASKEFFEALEGVTEPERKRVIIGNKFVEIFEKEARNVGAEYLVQGTIAPDWIESGGQLRDRIKAHHNVAGLPEVMELKLVEPLRDLYKDEVRDIARYLKISVAERQPFPGPGLAVRILGEVTPESVAVVRKACTIVEEEIERAAASGKMRLPWQYFAVLLPVRSVGVEGDVRVYGATVAVRVVDSVDGMTASYSKIPHDVLEKISVRITNEIKGVNRVVYDLTNKPPGTIEWE